MGETALTPLSRYNDKSGLLQLAVMTDDRSKKSLLSATVSLSIHYLPVMHSMLGVLPNISYRPPFARSSQLGGGYRLSNHI